MRSLDSSITEPAHRISQVTSDGPIRFFVLSSSLRQRREESFLPRFMLRYCGCDRITTLPRFLEALLAEGDLLLGSVAPS